MNQFCLAGKIASIPQVHTSPQGWKSCVVQLEVERPFANSKGEFESDLLPMEVWRGAAETLVNCAKVNSWITARGRIQARVTDRDKKGRPQVAMVLVAEKIEYIH